MLCASQEYLSQINFNPEDLSGLENTHFLSYQRNKNNLNLVNLINNTNVELKINTRMTSTSTAILRQAAIKGLGIACLGTDHIG